MKHFASTKFWQHFYALPENVQQLARDSYKLLKQNPQHPSFRALGVVVPEGVQWFWIGSHADYDKLLG